MADPAEEAPAAAGSASTSTSITTSTSTSAEYQLKKYLLLLATLVATVTYAAGLNLPGGTWLEDTPEGQLAGDSILWHTNFWRYIVFYYFNAISFAASLLLGLLLLLLFYLQKERSKLYLLLMWTVMLVDALGLMGAYAAGISHDKFTTICASVLVSGVSLYAAIAFLIYIRNPKSFLLRNEENHVAAGHPPSDTKPDKRHEILLVLAIFGATVESGFGKFLDNTVSRV